MGGDSVIQINSLCISFIKIHALKKKIWSGDIVISV